MTILEQHLPGRHARLILSGDVCAVVPVISEQAEERLQMLIQQMASKENGTEELQATNQMRLVQKINTIKERARDIVLKEMIFSV